MSYEIEPNMPEETPADIAFEDQLITAERNNKNSKYILMASATREVYVICSSCSDEHLIQSDRLAEANEWAKHHTCLRTD